MISPLNSLGLSITLAPQSSATRFISSSSVLTHVSEESEDAEASME